MKFVHFNSTNQTDEWAHKKKADILTTNQIDGFVTINCSDQIRNDVKLMEMARKFIK